jgi:ABC-type glycerol-3-phosphate transport system permease component
VNIPPAPAPGPDHSPEAAIGDWAWPRIAAVYVIVVTPGIIAFAFAQRLFFKARWKAC